MPRHRCKRRTSPHITLLILTGWVGSFPAFGQTTTASPIMGMVRVTINGTGSAGGANLVGPALVGPIEFQGDLDVGPHAPNTMKHTGANWQPNAFDLHPSAHSHYVEVVASGNGAAVGAMADIVSHTADTLTTAADLSQLLTGGETIVIRRHNTLAALFGAANESGLGGGDTSSADMVSVMATGTSSAFVSYYYRTGTALGGTGWRTSSNPFADQAQTPIRAGDGLLIKRKQAAPLEIVWRGFVKTGPSRRPLPSGYSLVDPLAPVTDQTGAVPQPGPKFTLGGTFTATTIPSGLETVFSPGTTQTADLISIFAAPAGFTSYYVAAPGPVGPGGWRTTSNPFGDAQATPLPANAAVLIRNRGPAKAWTRPQPFVLTSP